MSFIRTNDYLHNKEKNITIQFIKTATEINYVYNNILLYHPQYPLPTMIPYNIKTITFYPSTNIIPTIFYSSEDYLKKNAKEIEQYLHTQGTQIQEIYLPKNYLSYLTLKNAKCLHIFHIEDDLEQEPIDILGIYLAAYLNYTRICYTFPIYITLETIHTLKKIKNTYHLQNKLSICNCSNEENVFVHCQPLDKIIKPILLIQQFFIHKNPERQEELLQCLRKNVKNPYIHKIILLNETIYDLQDVLRGENLQKIQQINVGKRLSYYDVLHYIKHKINNHSICVIANTDIYFDETLSLLQGISLDHTFLALLRYNVNKSGTQPIIHDNGRPDSQDVWIIDSDIKIDINDEFKFQFGKPGCDNAITYLMYKNKYVISNPSLSIKSYHLHNTQIRDYTTKDLIITPYYLFSKPTKLVPLKKRIHITKQIDEKNIIYTGDMEEAFTRKNPFSYYDIQNLLEKRNENASDLIPWDNHNIFSRNQRKYIGKIEKAFVGTDGLIYRKTQNEETHFILNPIYENIDNQSIGKQVYYEKMATVVQRWGYGFYHFVCEQLPKIIYLQQHLLHHQNDIRILTYYNNTFIKELLQLCSIELEHIIPFHHQTQYRTDELYFPTPIYSGNPSKEDIQLIRSTLQIQDTRQTEGKGMGIIIKRKSTIARSIVNFDNIVALVKECIQEKHWVVFDMLHMKDSIALFQQADIIIAPHGAGLTNMIFSPKGTHIIEYVPKEEPNLCYWHLSELLGNHYYCIPVALGKNKSIFAPYHKTIETLYKITGNKLPTIHKPLRRNDGFNHSGDTFREMIDLWEENGFIKIIPSEEPHPWLNGVGNILLYDRPTYKWFIPASTHYKLGLFGNPNPPQNLDNNHPWIFWARRPRLLKKYDIDEKILSYEDRTILSAFIGKIENSVQSKHRTTYDWSRCVELFDMPINGNYKYTQEEYLEVMRKVKFGLCLRGFGVKCNREIELMALGVVPIFTAGVSKTYYNRLKKDVHYLYAKNPMDVKKVISNCSKKRWQQLSKAGRKWYQENCSILGSFKTTIRIIKEQLPGALDGYVIKDKMRKAIQIQHYGTEYGGFSLPMNLDTYVTKDSVLYLFGVGEDISFDTYLTGTLHCEVHLFDPTPRSIEHVRLVKEVIKTGKIPAYNKRYGGGDKEYWNKLLSYGPKAENIKMYPYGIYTEDTDIKFYKPKNEEYVSHSIVANNEDISNNYMIVPVKKIKTIMNELGHTHIDVMKLDVEGVECDIIHQMFEEKIYPQFLCVEFDIAKGTNQQGNKKANECIRNIVANGYQLIKRKNLDFSFMKIR